MPPRGDCTWIRLMARLVVRQYSTNGCDYTLGIIILILLFTMSLSVIVNVISLIVVGCIIILLNKYKQYISVLRKTYIYAMGTRANNTQFAFYYTCVQNLDGTYVLIIISIIPSIANVLEITAMDGPR